MRGDKAKRKNLRVRTSPLPQRREREIGGEGHRTGVR